MRDLCLLLRKEIPSIKIVIGGVHASSLPAESLSDCQADFVVIGEGEETIVELARFIQGGASGDPDKIPGIGFQRDGKFIMTEPRPLIDDLDSIPMPDWKQIDPNKYPKNPHGFLVKHKKVAPVFSSRGCPFSCHYCASCRFWGQRIRFRSPKNVVDEIEYLHREFGIREIHFWDDNLTLRRDHIIGICKEIIRRGLNHMAFCTPNGVRVDTLDEKILRWMRAAGFYKLTFAVESGSSTILKKNGKHINLRRIVQVSKIARRQGFLLNSFFMIGFPGETPQTIRKTIDFAKSLPFHYRTFFQLRPLPGSKIFEDWARGRDFHGHNWNDVNCYMQKNEVSLCGLDPVYLARMHKKAHRENVYRLKNVISLVLISIRYFQFSQLKFNLERLAHVFVGYNARIFRQ